MEKGEREREIWREIKEREIESDKKNKSESERYMRKER